MIPRVRIVVLAWALAARQLIADEQPSFDALMKLEGNAFMKAAEQTCYDSYGHLSPYNADQLIAIAEKCSAVVKPIGANSTSELWVNPFRAYFAEACKKANDRQLDKLLELYLRLDPNSFEKSQTLPALAGRVLGRELASIQPQHLELGDDEPALPPELKFAPEELKNAWKAFQRAKAAFEKAFPKTTEVIEESANEKSFYALIGGALRGATGREDEVRRYGWTGANCMGITDIEDAQDIAMLLMLVREGRMNEAIGAALRVAGTQGSTSSPEDVAKPVIDLLERCGLNWEEIFAGGQVEGEARGGSGESQHPYLDALASHGSERAAPLVNKLAHFAKSDARDKYLAVLGAWVENAPNLRKCKGEDYSYWSSQQKKRLAKPMPRRVQEMALHLTEELTTPDSSRFQADIAVDTFARTQAASSIPALQVLTRHSSDDVASHAEKVLCAMGQESSRQPIVASVRFQIFLNGKALAAGESIGCTIESNGNFLSSVETVAPDGIIKLPRDHFANPKQPVTQVSFHGTLMGENAVVFDTEVSPPWNFFGVTRIDIELSALEITLQNREGLNAPPSEKAFISINRLLGNRDEAAHPQGDEEITDGASAPSDFYDEYNQMKADPTIRLPTLQKGKYEVWVGVPGAEIWRGIVVVDKSPQKVSATLKPGSDVRFEIVLPGGLRRFWAPLLKDGKPIAVYRDSRTQTCHGLPYGKYVLKIPGSDPEGEERNGQKLTRGPDEIPFAGREVSFTIEKGSPAVIDLGEIHLKPLPR